MKKQNKKIKKARSNKYRELKQEHIILYELYRILSEEKSSYDSFRHTLSDRLKNPVTPILTYVDMMLEGQFGQLTPVQKEKMEKIKDSVKELNERISREFEI